MRYTKRMLLTTLTAVVLSASPRAIANPIVPMTDMDAAKAVKQANVSLDQAVNFAERSVTGQAIAARFAESADRPVYMIDVVDSQGRVQTVRVTADSGTVTGSWPKAEFQGDSSTYPVQ